MSAEEWETTDPPIGSVFLIAAIIGVTVGIVSAILWGGSI